MTGHEFVEAAGALICRDAQAQNCVPRWGAEDTMRPPPHRRVYAVDDIETFHARMIELETDRRTNFDDEFQP